MMAQAYGPREAVAADFELPSEELRMTARTVIDYDGQFTYGMPHSGNSTREAEEDRSYWFVAQFGRWAGEITGFLSRAEFNWLAARLGTPPLSDEERG
jgi:hypothetical protein